MNLNCDKIVEKYLLIQNPLYAFNFPISILVAIILFGCSKAYQWSKNTYVNQILIPILGFLLTMVLIELISKMMISNDEKLKLSILCKQWMHDPNVKKNGMQKLDMNMISNYRLENFSADENIVKQNLMNIINEKQNMNMNVNMNKENQVDFSMSELSNINPSPLQYAPNGNSCIENSNCCNLCSGTGNNPCNVVAPIPGPQWMPQSAEAVQNRLVNNNYTQSKCEIKK
jgi:hypothetical protein